MIVNPQFFNYKLIIGSLVVTIASLAVFGFSNYRAIKTEKDFLNQEKKLVETELSQMLLRYDSLFQNRELMASELNTVKKIYQASQEELRLLKSDFSILEVYKSRLSTSQSATKNLFNSMDSLYHMNKALELEKLTIDKALSQQKERNAKLQDANSLLENKLHKESEIKANSISAKAYKLENDLVATSKATGAKRIDVSLNLAENILAEKGPKEIYIQILNPLNNVIGKKSSVIFGKAHLIYSAKEIVNYNNESVKLSTKIMAQNTDIPFVKGTYYVSVFLKDRKLGDTQFVLN